MACDRLRAVPLKLAEANAFVVEHHRHHKPMRFHIFSIGAALGDKLVGVAIVMRPAARLRCDGETLEVSRLCTDGTKNACSFLYGRAARAAFALGYTRIGTYHRVSEPGTAAKAAGWKEMGKIRARTWTNNVRQRADKTEVVQRVLFETSRADAPPARAVEGGRG